MNADWAEVAAILRRARHQRGLTQTEFAHRAGFSERTTISRLERGQEDSYRDSTIHKLALLLSEEEGRALVEAFDKDPDDFKYDMSRNDTVSALEQPMAQLDDGQRQQVIDFARFLVEQG